MPIVDAFLFYILVVVGIFIVCTVLNDDNREKE